MGSVNFAHRLTDNRCVYSMFVRAGDDRLGWDWMDGRWIVPYVKEASFNIELFVSVRLKLSVRKAGNRQQKNRFIYTVQTEWLSAPVALN